MSLINKMLQDLDARAGQPGATPLPSDLRPVAAPERGGLWKRVAVAAGASAVLLAAGLAGWRFMAPQAAPASPAPQAAPATLARAAPAAAPAPAAPPPVPATPDPATPVVAFEVAVPPRQDGAATDASSPTAAAAAGEAAAAVAQDKMGPAQEAQGRVAAREAAQPAPSAASPAPARPAGRAAARQAAARGTAAAPAAKPARQAATKPVTAPKGGREETPAQRAENAYRRALASLDDGRLTEAIASLQGALKAAPRHEAARQTLVGLLVEAGRPEEAMRQLQAGLALDAAQPAMAMLLARLQIERGGSGIETLMRSLPHAAGNGEYHAFLAGALARVGRHREAAEHYGVALRTAPQNGVWWMGMGIALQADQRKPEAAGAFQKALDSGTLSAELQGFVERKLKQVAR